MEQDHSQIELQSQLIVPKVSSQVPKSSSQIGAVTRIKKTQVFHSTEGDSDQSLKCQDEQLYRLIKGILQHQEDESRKRQQSFESLFKLIPKLSVIRRNKDPRIDYQDALNRAFENVWRDIDKFPKLYQLDISDSDAERVSRCFLKWFNKILKRRIYDIYRELGKQPLSLEVESPRLMVNSGPALCTLDQIAHQEQLQKVKDYIRNDPDGVLQIHPDGAPQCSCQELCNRRLLSEPSERWRDIAQDLHLSQGTVTAFWHRQCKPLLREIPKKLGLLSEEGYYG